MADARTHGRADCRTGCGQVPRQHNNYREYEYFFQHLRSSAKPNAMWLGLTAFFVLLAFNYLRSHALKRRLAQLRHERPRLAVLAQTALASVTLLTIVVTTLIARHMVLGGSKLSIVGEVAHTDRQASHPHSLTDGWLAGYGANHCGGGRCLLGSTTSTSRRW